MVSRPLSERVRRFRYERLLASVASVPTFGAFTLVFAAAAIFGEIALCRIGCAIMAASLAYTTYRFLRSDWSFDGDYRTRLEQRRDFLRSFPYWGGLPTASGAALATLGWLLADPSRWFDATVAGVLGVGLQVALWASNNRTAAQLQREIESIDAA
jgi:hypothetical protein